MNTFFPLSCGRQHRSSASIKPSWLSRWAAIGIIPFFGLLLSTAGAARGEQASEVIAVYSGASPAYHRVVLSDGTFKPETYAFGEGGDRGGPQNDYSIDRLKFIDVARVIAPPLASRNYLPCDPKDPQHTDLLIMVYWGTTNGTDRTSSSSEYQIAQSFIPPPMAPLPPPPDGNPNAAMATDPNTSGRGSIFAQIGAIKVANDSAQQLSLSMTALANRRRDHQDIENAGILGYAEEMNRADRYAMTGLEQRRKDIVDEVEESRYYVVLMAYDFQTLLKHKERKLLWQTRYSIPERRNDFAKELAAMTQSASRYFGQDSHGLLRKPLPSTTVTLGDLKALGVEPEPKK